VRKNVAASYPTETHAVNLPQAKLCIAVGTIPQRIRLRKWRFTLISTPIFREYRMGIEGASQQSKAKSVASDITQTYQQSPTWEHDRVTATHTVEE
jgi:hypothetical protein